MLVPTVSLLELVIRGTILYFVILAALRIFRREAGALTTADLLVVVLVADAAQNAMAAEYHSVPEGVVLVATIFGWNFVLDWLGFHYPWVHRLLHPAPLKLIANGRFNRKNMRAELLTMEDLMEQLREQGVEDVKQVKQCSLESDGHLSVIRKEPSGQDTQKRKSEQF